MHWSEQANLEIPVLSSMILKRVFGIFSFNYQQNNDVLVSTSKPRTTAVLTRWSDRLSVFITVSNEN